MEASFVDELYNSLDSLNCRPNEEGSLELKGFCRKDNGKGTPTPSGQVAYSIYFRYCFQAIPLAFQEYDYL